MTRPARTALEIYQPNEDIAGATLWEPTDRQLLAASLLAEGIPWAAIIERLQCSRQTLHAWIHHPQFAALVDEYRARILGRYELRYYRVTELALEVIENALNGERQEPEVLRLARERVKVLDKIALARAESAYATEEPGGEYAQ